MKSNPESLVSQSPLRWSGKHPGFEPVWVPVAYRTEWPDGFGARGWKLDAAVGDCHVIASTVYTGEKVPTSVLVHDVLDHYISGFGFSGHRNEAMATAQLGLRGGAEIRSSYLLMVHDILHGEVEGESLDTFLPPSLKRLLPTEALVSVEKMHYLAERLSKGELHSILLSHFYEIGLSGVPRAIASWTSHGLDYERRAAIGLCLQRLLARAETLPELRAGQSIHGAFSLDNELCALALESPDQCKLWITFDNE